MRAVEGEIETPTAGILRSFIWPIRKNRFAPRVMPALLFSGRRLADAITFKFAALRSSTSSAFSACIDSATSVFSGHLVMRTLKELQMSLPGINLLLAFKAVALTDELSASEKRVAAAILDHFNRKTAQCDPSLEGLARLLTLSRSTVIRAVNRLAETGFLQKDRHRGHFHRNSYTPCWAKYRQAEAAWSARRHHGRMPSATTVTPSQLQPGDSNSGQDDTQTCQKNLSYVTLAKRTGGASPDLPGKSRISKGHPEEVPITSARHAVTGSSLRGASTSFYNVALAAAERRWNVALLQAFKSDPGTYARIVEAITAELQTIATEAEMRRKGDGLHVLFDHLRLPDVAAPDKAITCNRETGSHGSFLQDLDAGISDSGVSAVCANSASLNSTKYRA